MDSPAMIEAVKPAFQDLQQSIVQALSRIDPGLQWLEDSWERPAGGGGTSIAASHGDVFEKLGVNFSDVHGDKLPPSASARRPELAGSGFRAMGVSIVIHPLNPYVPTTHMNVRFFTTRGEKENGANPLWWFGGGFDLTPYYPFEEDVVSWHQQARDTCDRFDPDYYPRFKAACDAYFSLPHRQETRGVGGLFFDDLNTPDFDHCFGFTRAVGQSFFDAYRPIVDRRRELPWGTREREFQCYRRGRYVEFNLLYDRGTLFGLQSGGRTESILMSLPPMVSWIYQYQPEPDSPEAELTERFLKPRDWLK